MKMDEANYCENTELYCSIHYISRYWFVFYENWKI